MRSGEICPAQILRHQLHQLALRREAELTGFLLEPKFLPDDLTVLPLLIKLDQRVGFLIPSDVLCLETLSFRFSLSRLRVTTATLSARFEISLDPEISYLPGGDFML